MTHRLFALVLPLALVVGCASELDEPSTESVPASDAKTPVVDTDTIETQASKSRAARQALPTPNDCLSICLSGRYGMTPGFCAKSCNPG